MCLIHRNSFIDADIIILVAVQGLVSIRKDGQTSLLCIDEEDCMFQIDWSKFLDQCMDSQDKTGESSNRHL